jgi:hypothetical protein
MHKFNYSYSCANSCAGSTEACKDKHSIVSVFKEHISEKRETWKQAKNIFYYSVLGSAICLRV